MGEAERSGRPVAGTLVVKLGNPEATPGALGPFGASPGDAASGDGVRDGFLLEAWISDPEIIADGDGTAEIVKGIVQETGCRYRCGRAGDLDFADLECEASAKSSYSARAL